jgi:glyoxylase-like metal-dependent hydrolase (beta-lactamase superfamily II)
MSSNPLAIDVYVAPIRPYVSPDRLGEGEVATWAPSSSTLISGPREGILIDALLTFENADQIAAWATSSGKKITGVYITHGHSDHWLGLARLLEHFPEANRENLKLGRLVADSCLVARPLKRVLTCR